MARAAQRDPRSIITPDAFEVSGDLIGMPLATPRRRAVALAVDGVVILFITAITRNFELILGVLVAFFFIRAGFRRTEVRGSVFGRAMRFSVGCLGVLVGIVTAALWAAFGIGGLGGDEMRDQVAERVVVEAGEALAGMSGMVELTELGSAVDREEALESAAELLRTSREAGLPDDLVRGLLLAGAPDSVSWRDEWEAAVDSLIAVEGPDGRPPAEVAGEVDAQRVAELREEVDAMEAAAVLAEVGGVLESREQGAESAVRRELLVRRATEILAGDSLEALTARATRLERVNRQQEGELEEVRAQLEAAESRGIVSRLLGLANDLGFGFGWAALYLTVFLTWWNGQTVGKRMLGVRVVRLDGEPLTWWIAFERVGGYAAGLATGLLGFAQVWWDANRQAIHDRIVGTVVVVEGGEKVTDWESAL